jgi:hypothetical protein
MTFFSLFKKHRLQKRRDTTLEEDQQQIPPPLDGTGIEEMPPQIPSQEPSTAPPSGFKKVVRQLPLFVAKYWSRLLSHETQQQATTLFSKMEQELSGLQKRSPQQDTFLLRPGVHENSWQLWQFPSAKESSPKLLDEQASPITPSQKRGLTVGVPTRDLVVIPLWIATEGERKELIELELGSKHLLRRGMAEGLKTIPLENREGRTLVVVLAPTSSPSIATAPYLKAADQFEAAARLFPHQYADLLVWRELGEVCFGFSRKEQFVWFSGTNETEVTRTTLGLIRRMTLRLEAEEILQETPRSLHVFGSFSEEERTLLKSLIGMPPTALDSKRYNYYVELPPPILSTPRLDLPDEAARAERLHQEKRLRLKRGLALLTLIYLCLLLLAAGNLFINRSILHYFQHHITQEQPAIAQANETITQWQEFRPAIDPTTYPLDILAEIASQIHGEKIRLITLTGINGRLQIVGEATDVAQAYHFIEPIKKTPKFQEYEWSSGQPKLAGKSSVRFELEGSRHHEKTSTE